MNYYFDVDGVLANFHEVKDGWKFSGKYDFIRNLNPFVESINLVNAMIETGYNVYISTLVRNEEAKRARLEWLLEYLPNLKVENIIIMVGSAKKFEHMVTDDGVLVDDKLANVKQWRKAGFQAIFVENKGEIDIDNIE